MFPLFPRLSRILARSLDVRQPRINLSDDVGIKGGTGLLHRRSKSTGSTIPEDALNGRRELSRASFGGGGGGDIQTRVCLGNILQSGIDFNVVHEQGHMVTLRDVVNTESPVVQLFQLP